jgi:dTDP-glucose pyrophosphorylase
MTAVVLARGAGRRMRAPVSGATLTPAQATAAAAGHKVMMPIANGRTERPVIDKIHAAHAAAGCARICLVIGPDQGEIPARYRRDARPSRFELLFADQRDANGTAKAVLAAAEVIGDVPFLVVNGDNLYPAAALRDLAMLDTPGLPAFSPADLVATGNIPASRIAAFALIDVDERGWLQRIVEKPEPETLAARGDGARVSMNAWRFDRRIVDACREVPKSARGEYELPGAVALALTQGVRFRVIPAAGPVLDLSQQGDVAEVSRRLAAREVCL